jgi:hypothetical protein
MFNAYEYIESIAPDVPEIKKVYKASGLSALEDVLSDIKNNPDCCSVVRDSGDGYLNLKDTRLDNSYQTLYVFVMAKVNDHDTRLRAKRQAMDIGVKLFDRIKEDSNDFGDPAFGLNFARIEYNEIGPIGRGYYGYSFSYTFDDYLK